MSAKGFGCVGVTDRDGRLVGVITDGDLRRHMRDDLLAAPVDDVMTASPKTVRPDQFASEALQILNDAEDHGADRGRRAASRSASCISTICCAPASPEPTQFAIAPLIEAAALHDVRLAGRLLRAGIAAASVFTSAEAGFTSVATGLAATLLGCPWATNSS